MNTRRPQPSKSAAAVDDEVNQLLQAAQDELLLNLSVGSHNVSNSDLDPDLARRFLALKSRPSASSVPVPAPAPALTTPQQTRSSATSSGRVQGQADDETKPILGDDLSARFAALRGSTSSGSPLVEPTSGVDRSLVDVEEDEDEEEEVEKLLRWAMDAARLDPSPPSDDDVDDVSSSDSDLDVGNENEKRNSSRKQK
ncbi:hypothetical protein MLD38_009880 [Melastoma candidum]|uniref:Uncharacterized protein n=1 Tax=Melastoma candidum TaxID=119954 RepID=A0ACB9S0G3_9MYRT|nr:hypothetical protein MLD38_009880 [Melastoma candidum]